MLAHFANPARFMALSAWAAPLCLILAAVLFVIGLPWAMIYSPPDYQQGETVRIMYVHVPAAWWSLGIYAFMGAASFVGLPMAAGQFIGGTIGAHIVLTRGSNIVRVAAVTVALALVAKLAIEALT